MYLKQIDYNILKHLIGSITIIPRTFCTMCKVIPRLEEKINEQIINDELNIRKHPGIIKNDCIGLPDKIKKAITDVMEGSPKKQLLNESVFFARYLHSRQLPIETNSLRLKANSIKEEIENSINIDKEMLNDDEQNHLTKLIESKTQKILKQRIYNWQPVNYSRNKGIQYLIARAPPEYAVLIQIFKEIKIRDNYTPTTLFDFGSGVGTVSWAANEIWDSELKEIFCVDSSKEMNSLAEELSNLGVVDSKMKNKIMYRQFLPKSYPQYDVVVSAYSLMELPSSKARLETISKLWNKTTKYLILVEQGTMAGFKVISEARNFILEANIGKGQNGHIFSPCPHDLPCPRLSKDGSLCNFKTSYCTHSSREPAKAELYSYAVISKEPRQVEGEQWPRIVQPVLKRSRHVICRMCTGSGEIKEITFSPSKHEKILYRCARSSNWGDRLPFILENKSLECSNLKKKRNSSIK